MPKYAIGIDPGTKTGVAVYSIDEMRFTAISTLTIVEAIDVVRKLYDQHKGGLYIIVEDARQRKWYGSRSQAKLQGAGSIKRDCKIWEEVTDKLELANVIFQAPKKSTTKVSADYFKRLTGWKGRTSEHARDAAMLVQGLNPRNIKLIFRN